MSEKPRFYVGSDPNGYGGAEEVRQEQADAYAEAIAAGLRERFPEYEILVAMPDGYVIANAKHLAVVAWVQSNWRRIRAEVNAKNGWEEQFGGTLLVDMHRKF